MDLGVIWLLTLRFGFCLSSSYQLSSVQSLSCVWLFATPWTAACQASLSITNSQSLLKFISIESVINPLISSSVVPFSSRLQSFPASGSFPFFFFSYLFIFFKNHMLPILNPPPSQPPHWSFPMSQLFTSGGQSIGVSASTSVLPMNIQDWCPLGWTG